MVLHGVITDAVTVGNHRAETHDAVGLSRDLEDGGGMKTRYGSEISGDGSFLINPALIIPNINKK